MVRVLGLAEIILFILILVAVLYMYYFQHTGAAAKNRQRKNIAWEVANDDEVRALLPHRKNEAIQIYQELTGVDSKMAQAVIEYLIANPDDFGESDKKKVAPRDAGIRELVRQGRISEAIDIYRDFTGTTTKEAAEDIAQIEQELALEEPFEEIDSPSKKAQSR